MELLTHFLRWVATFDKMDWLVAFMYIGFWITFIRIEINRYIRKRAVRRRRKENGVYDEYDGIY